MPVTILHGDNIAVLKTFADHSVDSIVTDPPYGLSQHTAQDVIDALTAWMQGREYLIDKKGFMGKTWDSFVPGPELWREAYRVLKPGGHLLCFAGSRTDDLMGIAIRLAGFEIRDKIMWLYGGGMPKSMDVAKAIDKAGGLSPADQAVLLREKREAAGLSRAELAEHIGCTEASVRDWEEGRARAKGRSVEHIIPSPDYRERLAELLGYSADERHLIGVAKDRRDDGTVYAIGHSGVLTGGGNTEASARWMGWGTALKPAFEPVIVARKPLVGTVAETVLRYGTGAINIDACRVHIADGDDIYNKNPHTCGGFGHAGATIYGDSAGAPAYDPSKGRWPANVAHDGSEEVEAAFEQFGEKKACMSPSKARSPVKILGGSRTQGNLPMDEGTASRYFYNTREGEASADRRYTDRGSSNFAMKPGQRREAVESYDRFFYCAKANKQDRAGSKHPTVKPVALMRWLVRMVTPPGGVVLDPFAGSGTTGQAAVDEGFNAVLIEREDEYVEDIRHRLLMWTDDGSTEALARVVAAANLAEDGRIPVTSTDGMSDEEFRDLIKLSTNRDDDAEAA